MNKFLLLIIAILPVILIGMYMYKKDKNKEPTSLLIKLFFGGVCSTFVILLVTLILQALIPFFGLEDKQLNIISLILYVFIGIALIEELSKWIFVYKISYNNEEFDEFYDILLYSAFVALGFAGFENIFYVLENGIYNGFTRAITSVPGHVFFGIFMGYYLGLAKLNSLNGRSEQSKKNIILSIIIPIILHGLFDYLLYATSISGNFMFIIIWIGFVVFMYIYCIKRIMKVSKLTGKFRKGNITYEENNNKYCSNCGKLLEGLFCSHCGKRNN